MHGRTMKSPSWHRALLQCPSLLLGFFSDRRTSADALVIGHAFRGSAMGDNPGDGFLQESRPKANNLPVGEQIEEKGADVLKTLGTA